MSRTDQDLISRLNQALSESMDLYSAAAESATSKENSDVFERVANARGCILNHLAPFTLHGHEPEFYAFGSVLQKVYPDMLERLDAHSDPALTAICRQSECELCDLLKDTLDATQSALLRSLLVDLFPELNGALRFGIAS